MDTETIEKIYCHGKDNNDALIGMLAGQQKGTDPMAMCAMMNGCNGQNQQWNNPFIYLVWMMFAQRMWGNGENGAYGQNNAIQDQLNSMRSQMSTDQNSNLIRDAIAGNGVALNQLAGNLNCDFNTLQQSVCAVQSAIQNVGGQVGFSAERVINAANVGDMNIITALKDCCCATQKAIIEQGAEARLATCQQTNTLQTTANANAVSLHNTLDSGFNSVHNALNNLGYQNQQQSCDIINAINAAQQKTAEQLNSHWSLETSQKLQDAKFEISQLKQNQYLANIINGGCGCTGNVGV